MTLQGCPGGTGFYESVNARKNEKGETDPEDDRPTTKRCQCERYWTYQLHSLKPLGHQCVRIRHQQTSVIYFPLSLVYFEEKK